MIQAGHEIDPLHAPILAMVIVPANDVILVRVGLFSDAVIKDHHPILLLDLPHIRLDRLPQLGRLKPVLG
jgi:hypothetical protein